MKLHIAHLPWLIAQRRSVAVLGAIIIAMLWAGIVVKYFERVYYDESEAERTNENFAMVFEENVLRTLGELDTAILYFRQIVETRQGTTDYQTILNTTHIPGEVVVQAAIVDAKGIIRASTSPLPKTPISVADREHIRVQLNSVDDQLFISKPVIGRASGQWSVQLTRRFNDPHGSIGGVIVVSMDPDHFTTFYDKIDLGSAAAIAMIGSDGVIRASGGGAAGRFALGQSVVGTSLFKRISEARSTSFEFETTDQQHPLLIALRKVRGYPLWLSVGERKADVLQPSLDSLKWNVLIGVLFTLMIVAAIERILRSEASTKQKSEQLKLTLEHMSQGIMLVTKDREVPIINRRCGELLELPSHLIDRSFHLDAITPGQNDSKADLAVYFGVGPESDWRAPGGCGVFEHTRSDGAVIEVRRTGLPEGGFVQTFTDVTKRREAEAYIAKLASEDPLTGLPNRRILRAAIEKLSTAEGVNSDFGVLFLDLDQFKIINDTLGHRVGDMLLVEVARRLQQALRPGDVLARLGGDEFAIVMPSFRSRTAIATAASAIVDTIAQPYDIDGHGIRSAVSIGIAIGPSDGNNADDLLMAADLALYAVKSNGRGTYCFYEHSMNAALNDRRRIETELREAIEQNRLRLEYQPIIDLRRNIISGFEALARWEHATMGAISPSVFVPIAEDSGLIMSLGEWAIREACSQAARWPNDLTVSVNLSPVQFSLPTLADTIAQILAETGLAPHRLVLEITERLFISDVGKTLATLHRLKAMGVRIAMDDFGTGYSSLSSLRSFPFDKIKIDRAFVSDLGENSQNSVIVQAIIIIARALGMATVAEGVETVGQQRLLTALGCDEVQGYLFSKAVPLERVPEIIAALGGDPKTLSKTIAA